VIEHFPFRYPSQSLALLAGSLDREGEQLMSTEHQSLRFSAKLNTYTPELNLDPVQDSSFINHRQQFQPKQLISTTEIAAKRECGHLARHKQLIRSRVSHDCLHIDKHTWA